MLFQSGSAIALMTILAQSPIGFFGFTESDSDILFTITQQSSSYAPKTLDGRDWRHNYDMLLTRTTEVVSIFDEFGIRHDFHTNEDDSSENILLPGIQSESGSISRHGDVLRWLRPNGSSVDFIGSLPYRIETIDDQKLILDYEGGRLSTVRDEDNDSLHFHYSNGTLSRVEPDEHSYTCEQDAPDSSNPAINECDVDENPPPADTLTSSFADAFTVDLRPASCNSYFVEYFGTTRGQEIEYGLATNPRYERYTPTVRSFPIVDLIADDELLVVRSRDLTSSSYDSEIFPEGLLRRLLQDAADIQNKFITPLQDHGFLQTTELHETTYVDHEVLLRPVVLEVIIRHGYATPAHIAQINRARAIIEDTHSIELRIIEIP